MVILTLVYERRANSPGVIRALAASRLVAVCAPLMYQTELYLALRRSVFICCAAGWVQLDVILQLDILVHVMLLTLSATEPPFPSFVLDSCSLDLLLLFNSAI